MVSLDRIYTRGGDGGETSLGDGRRVPKHALRVEVMGDVDEASAMIGLARLHVDGDPDLRETLMRIQNDLFDVGADLCVPDFPDVGRSRLRVVAGQVERLEREIDAMNARLAPLKSFILPGGRPLAAALHAARAVVRRAERRACELARAETVNLEVVRYLNRLSDHLFVAARRANGDGADDTTWIPGGTR